MTVNAMIFLGACILGTGMHFLYEPLGRPRGLGFLLPVSESPWEHTKLCFWPLCLALGLWGGLTGCGLSALLWGALCAVSHGACAMLGIYYLSRAALGVPRPVLWVDIGSFFAAMGTGFPLGVRILARGASPLLGCAGALGLAAWALFFAYAAFSPPKYPLFQQAGREISHTYRPKGRGSR